MFAWFRRRREQASQLAAMAIEVQRLRYEVAGFSSIAPLLREGVRVADALLALGNHDLPPNTVNAVPHGALACLSRELYQGQMEIANALRSLASVVKEHIYLERNPDPKAEQRIYERILRERRALGAARRRWGGETPPARVDDTGLSGATPPDQRG